MKNIFKTKAWLLGLTALLFINSCRHESMAPAVPEGAPVLSKAEDMSDGGSLAKLRQRSLQNWEDFKAALPDFLVERDGKVFLKEGLEKSSEGDCFCGYEIIEVALEHPAGYPSTLLEFYAMSTCSPHSSCRYFHAGYADDPSPGCFSSPQNCIDFLPPSFAGAYPFKCGIPAYSFFDVLFFFLPVQGNCASFGSRPLSWKIKFKIHCIGEHYAEGDCDRPTGAWVQYSSEEMAISAAEEYFGQTSVSLSGCGCKPLSNL